MFLLEGKPLAPDRPFVTSDGTQYPANWLRLASLAEKQAIGITEAPDPRPYDQRFYWGYSDDGSLIEKDLTQLKTQWVSTVKQTANSMLSQSDWMVIRETDPSSGKILSDEIKNERSLIRQKSDEKETKINNFQTVGELAAYVTSSEYHSWSNDPVVENVDNTVVTDTSILGGDDTLSFGDDTLSFTGGTTSGGFTTGTSIFGDSSDTVIFS